MFLPSEDSPFFALWYLYLFFVGVVILVNVLSKCTTAFIRWRTRRMVRKHRSLL